MKRKYVLYARPEVCNYTLRPQKRVPFNRPKRLQGKRPVSIAAGFKCRDGVVVAADTQYDLGLLKINGPKLFTHTFPGMSLIFAGAGDIDFIKMTVQMIRDEVSNGSPDSNAVKEIVKKTVTHVYRKHVYPYPAPSNEKPHFDLLVGLWKQGESVQLLKTSRTGVMKVEDYECLGVGMYLGKYIVDSVFRPNLSVRQAEFLAIELIEEAKRYVPGCGGETHIVTMNSDGSLGQQTKQAIRLARHVQSKLGDFGRICFFEFFDPLVNPYASQIFNDLLTSFGEEFLQELQNEKLLPDYDVEESRKNIRNRIYNFIQARIEQTIKEQEPPVTN